MKKFKCSKCGKLVKDRGLACIVWSDYNGNQPANPRVVCKNWRGTRICDDDKNTYSYEISDFVKDFPKVVKEIDGLI